PCETQHPHLQRWVSPTLDPTYQLPTALTTHHLRPHQSVRNCHWFGRAPCVSQGGMRVRDMGLAVLTSVIWGFAYVTYRFGLESFSATQLTALRFVFACLPVLFVPRPKLGWLLIALIGAILFAGQFLLLMLAYARGMPAGLGSVTQQTQAVLT